MDDKFLSLPWQIQLALGSGYMAYLIAYSGIRQHHTTTDVAFRSISFGLVGTAIQFWMPLKPVFLEAVSLVSTLAAGAFWRWKGMRLTKSILSKTNITWSDDIPSAWLSVTAMRTDITPSQVSVDLENGRILVCDDTRRFKNAPHGPCIFGLDGSLALYVTAERRPDGTWLEITDVYDAKDGHRLTYVPASEIKRVELRLWAQTNEKAASEASSVHDEAAEKTSA